MAKGKPPRSRRKRGRRPMAPAAGAEPPSRPVAAPVAATTPGVAERPREVSAPRFSARDYGYVRREIRRIILLATAIIIVIVVLSFFLP